MPKIKMTPTGVRRLVAPDPSGRQTIYQSLGQSGLQIIVSGNTTSRGWAVQGHLNGKTLRITLAPVSANVDADEITRMEKLAQSYRETMKLGLDPRVENKRRAKTEASANITVEGLWKAHVASQRWTRLKVTSRRTYEIAWKETIGPTLGNEIARDLRLRDVAAIYPKWVSAHGHGISRLAVILLKSIWKTARLLELVDQRMMCPAENLEELIPDWGWVGVRKTDVPDEKLRDFWMALGGMKAPYQTKAMAKFLLLTGLRDKEARFLEWSEVSEDRWFLRLPSGRVKNGKEFLCPLSGAAKAILDDLAERKHAESTKFGHPKRFVFSSGDGNFDRPPGSINTKLMGIAEKLEVDRLTTHTLRKIFARVAEEATDLATTKRLLNHSFGRDVTLRHYIVRSTERMLKESDAVGEAVMLKVGGEVGERQAQARSEAAGRAEVVGR